MRTWKAVSWDGVIVYVAAWTESDAYQQAVELLTGGVQSFNEQ